MNRTSRIFVCGGSTLIGAALIHRLQTEGFTNLIGVGDDEPDPIDPVEIERFFAAAMPEFVFVAAGRSGGIGLNRSQPADLMLDNLRVAANVIPAAQRYSVSKLLYLASSCAYPRDATQPLVVESLCAGKLEPTSEPYATAKLAGWKLCEAYRQQHGCRFITGVPANAFGPNDDFTEDGGHVIPALIRRVHEAKASQAPELVVWGTGTVSREFIYAGDLAAACIFVMQHYDGDAPINLGTGTELRIAEVAQAICDVVGYRGRVVFDSTKPDGAPRKCLDSTPLRSLGWRPHTAFRDALTETFRWFRLQLDRGAVSQWTGAGSSPPQITSPTGRVPSSGAPMHSRLYRSLLRIRRVEEEIAKVYATDAIKSPVHLSIGQEAVSVGVCDALRLDDVVFGTYRGHAAYLAKGGDLNAMVAELFGRVTGCTRGKGGSMHLIDPEAGVMGTSAVVGTTIANAAGYAYAMRLRRRDSVVVSFFGDGASEEGVFAETLNFAVLKKLPVLFVCENNGYAIHTSQSRRQGVADIRAKAAGYGLPAELLDGNDVISLANRTREVVARLRAGEGPWFFEVKTYRWREHVGPGVDYHLGFRTESECEPWTRSDPVGLLGHLLPEAERNAIEAEVEDEVAAAFAFAEGSQFPEGHDLMTDIFKEETDVVSAR